MNLNVKVLKLSGMLNAQTGDKLRQEISDCAETGVNIILVDLKHVNFVDSSGLGALVSSRQILNKVNGKLFICTVNEQVKALFELTKMDRIFQIFADRDEFYRQVLNLNINFVTID
ncbi:STAS domain-containing protein [Richelia sinica]|nr:STAS domain-containing protein [Richelia sinica]MBD2664477.1 STAS domain-containing protein [Richelia sinica FACHB-800]